MLMNMLILFVMPTFVNLMAQINVTGTKIPTDTIGFLRSVCSEWTKLSIPTTYSGTFVLDTITPKILLVGDDLWSDTTTNNPWSQFTNDNGVNVALHYFVYRTSGGIGSFVFSSPVWSRKTVSVHIRESSWQKLFWFNSVPILYEDGVKLDTSIVLCVGIYENETTHSMFPAFTVIDRINKKFHTFYGNKTVDRRLTSYFELKYHGLFE